MQKGLTALMLAAVIGTLGWIIYSSDTAAPAPKTAIAKDATDSTEKPPPKDDVAVKKPEPKPEPPKSEPTTTDSADPQVADADKTGAPKKKLDLGAVFGTVQKVTKSLDTEVQKRFALKDEEEVEIGGKINRMILDKNRMRPEGVARIEALAKPILATRSRKQIPYSFYVIDRKEINAFSHLGGYIYVHQGLIDDCRDDTELQFVLAHEIAHIDLGHCKEKALVGARIGRIGGELFGDVAGDLLGGIAQVGYSAIEAGYSEDKEFEADDWGCRCLLKAGKDRASMLRFLHRMAQKEPSPTNAPAKTGLDRLGQELAGHFRTHPASVDRIRRLEAIRID